MSSSVVSSTYDKRNYPKATTKLVTGGIVVFVANLFLIIAIISPYWVQSFEKAYADFKNMGLWQYCYNQFKFPYFQYNYNFHGCHSIYSREYFAIREWLLPGWLLFCEIFMTVGLVASLTNLVNLALIVIRYPKHFVLKNEWILTSVSFTLSLVVGFFTLVTLLIFYAKYESQSWSMYPQFNFLSWSFWSAAISCVMHAVAARLFYVEARNGYERRQESRNLIMRMHETRQSLHTSPSHQGYF